MLKDAEYWKAFNAGMAAGEKAMLRKTFLALQGLKEVKGIGEKTYEKIIKAINEGEVKK